MILVRVDNIRIGGGVPNKGGMRAKGGKE